MATAKERKRRAVVDLRALADVIEMAGTYDQLNLAALASFELIGRRWQLILSAHSRCPTSPDYEGMEHFEGLEKKKFGIAPVSQEHVARKLRDESEIEKQRSKARGLRTTPAKVTPAAKAEAALAFLDRRRRRLPWQRWRL